MSETNLEIDKERIYGIITSSCNENDIRGNVYLTAHMTNKNGNPFYSNSNSDITELLNQINNLETPTFIKNINDTFVK